MQQCYSPRISPELVSKLYQLKQQKGVPMTVIADRAISEYCAKHEQEGGDEYEDNAQAAVTTKAPEDKKTEINPSGNPIASGICDCISPIYD